MERIKLIEIEFFFVPLMKFILCRVKVSLGILYLGFVVLQLPSMWLTLKIFTTTVLNILSAYFAKIVFCLPGVI